MELKLHRPLVFFDLEATGPDRTKDRITQYCFHIFFPDGTNQLFESIVNPEIPIPALVASLTGITDEMAAKFGAFRHHADQVFEYVDEVDLVGFGCLMFDVPLLFNELQRCDITWDYTKCNIIDACNIYKRNVPRDLSSALRYYCDRSLHGAHNAKADVEATRDVFLFQIEKHQLTTDITSLAKYSNYDKPIIDLSGKFSIDEEGDIIYNFSSKKGCKVKHDTGMLYWILTKDFSEDVKIVCRRLINEFDQPVDLTDGLPF